MPEVNRAAPPFVSRTDIYASSGFSFSEKPVAVAHPTRRIRPAQESQRVKICYAQSS